MNFDARELGDRWREAYRLCTAFIQPRPIAFVSTRSQDGTRNLAPYSFYNMVSANPPIVMFAPTRRRDGSWKDSLQNVESGGDFVVATVTEPIVERMNQCSFDYAPEVDEFEASGLTARPASVVRADLVVESPINLECVHERTISFGEGPGAGSAVFGRVLMIHIDDSVLADDGLPDADKLRAVGRMGRSQYARTDSVFDVPRPTA